MNILKNKWVDKALGLWKSNPYKNTSDSCDECMRKGNYCHQFNPRIPFDFLDWEKRHEKRMQKLKQEYSKKSISILKKMQKPHKGSPHHKNTKNNVIELKNVNKWYFNKNNQTFQKILHNVNINIMKGEFVVVLGESGSGKTTLLNLMSGMERCSNGTTIVSNHNLSVMNEHKLTNFRRKYISIIFQNYALTTDLTIKENVDFGASLQEDVRKRLNTEPLYHQLSIEEQKNKLPSQLSGGQQQRAAILKSLAKVPTILFADEPTGAVDEETCKNILKIFKDINKKYRTTIILITHNRLIAEIATKIIHINNGKIIDIQLNDPKPVDLINWKNVH